jgi:hypothetical protein
MEVALTRGLYTRRYGSTPGPFGLFHGQQFSQGLVVQGAGWFNGFGQHLGTGDLLPRQLTRLRTELPPGEMFIVLDGPQATDRALADRGPARAANLSAWTKFIVTYGEISLVVPDPDSMSSPHNLRTLQDEPTTVMVQLISSAEALAILEELP